MKVFKLFIILLLTISIKGYGQFHLSDFFVYDAELAQKTDSVFQNMSDTARVGQLIMPAGGSNGISMTKLNALIKSQKIGGILMLKGSKTEFSESIQAFNNLNKGLPLFYAADAEPSLIGMKISGTTPIKKASEMNDRTEVELYANMICENLKEMGIQYNFAPVVDMSPNKIISYRSFGNNPDTSITWSNVFIQSTQNNDIVATAKHFPGHGLVSGDSHKNLVYIDGELKEVKNYIPLIKEGVVSIMVGHIAVQNNPKYNTNGRPSSCSRNIVTDLLKKEMRFKGIVVTDAMNMGGVLQIENRELAAVKAGCDLILMPVDSDKAWTDIYLEIQKNKALKQQVYASAKKIIRLKICLGLL